MPCILLTGATGYIASHTWLALQEAGFDVVGIDSLVNSSVKVLDRLETIGRRAPHFVQGDVRDAAALDRCFELARTRFGGIQAVVHFAALKAVGESVERPLDYFENNLGGLLSVCQAMKRHGVNNLVFSSSATVYGDPQKLPLTEDHPLSATNPYGQTKLVIENMLRELHRSKHLHAARHAGREALHVADFKGGRRKARLHVGRAPAGRLEPHAQLVGPGARAPVTVGKQSGEVPAHACV